MLCSLDFRLWIALLILAVLLAGATGATRAQAQATDTASRLSEEAIYEKLLKKCKREKDATESG